MAALWLVEVEMVKAVKMVELVELDDEVVISDTDGVIEVVDSVGQSVEGRVPFKHRFNC